MAVTFFCRTCGAQQDLDFGLPEGWFFCGQTCHDELAHAVSHLAAGGNLAELGIASESRLAIEAIKDVQAIRRREVAGRREAREQEYERYRARPMRPIYRPW